MAGLAPLRPGRVPESPSHAADGASGATVRRVPDSSLVSSSGVILGGEWSSNHVADTRLVSIFPSRGRCWIRGL